MSRTIVLKSRHDLDVERIKQRITTRFERLKAEWIDRIGAAEMTWTGDTAHVDAKALGQTAHATIDVLPHDVTITIILPMILAPFGGAIETFLKGNADTLKADPKTG